MMIIFFVLQLMIRAIKEGDEDLYLTMLAERGDPKVNISSCECRKCENNTWCLLAMAAYNGHSHLLPHLIAAGLDLEGSGQTSYSPLHWAAQEGHNQVMTYLLNEGADPHATNVDGQ